MSRFVNALPSLFAFVICCILVIAKPCWSQSQAMPFCDSFDDGAGFLNRWTVYQGYQTPVGSPTHSGDTALEFHGGCHSSIYRTGFSANYGEYSAWVNQQHSIAHFSVYIQFATGTNPDPDPVFHTGYELSLSAANSSANIFYVSRDSGGVQAILGTGAAKFVLGEWIKVFVRRLPYGIIVAGYERTAGLPLRDSIICADPQPLTAPGKFLLWACSDVPPYTYFDDACYAPLSGPDAPPICFDRGADLNCSGAADVQDVLFLIYHVFLNGPAPTCTKP